MHLPQHVLLHDAEHFYVSVCGVLTGYTGETLMLNTAEISSLFSLPMTITSWKKRHSPFHCSKTELETCALQYHCCNKKKVMSFQHGGLLIYLFIPHKL